MKSKYGKRRSNALPTILLLLVSAVVVLVIVIAMTGGRQGEDEPSSETDSPSSVSVPSSSEPVSDGEPASSSASEPQVSESQSSESETAAQSSSSSSSAAPSSSSSSASSAASGEQDKYYEKDKPLLVNPTNKVPTGYAPKLESIVESYKMDERAAVAFKDMLGKAWEDGISLWVVSAYRSNDKQTANFNSKVTEYEGQGYTAAQAYAETAKWIAIPGTSEHETGLAVDVNSLYTNFENTKEFKWLISNCADFGFILRYPKDKVEITSISYEPWHYRYVGSNHASIIMDKGICLEEYLSGDY